MRGAPQVGFSATIRKIKARTSLLTRLRPPTWLILETHVQYKRNPARCQFTTVLGVTKTRGCLHLDQHILNATQNSLCRVVNRRRGRCACSASNCRRRAKFSRTRSARQLKELTNQPRKCRSDKIMAKNFSGKDRIELCAKSLISLVYDLLARHNPPHFRTQMLNETPPETGIRVPTDGPTTGGPLPGDLTTVAPAGRARRKQSQNATRETGAWATQIRIRIFRPGHQP